MHSLERLDVFVLARDLAVRIYKMTRTRPLAGHHGLADQLGRATISIPANIAEAYALGTTRQLIRGLRIAYGSAIELHTLLWIAEKAKAVPPPTDPGTPGIIGDLERVISMLIGLLKHYGARVGPADS
jgi:four helix bundle protein